jgi:hypothetical protein
MMHPAAVAQPRTFSEIQDLGCLGACSPSRRERDLTSVNFDLIDRFLLEGQLDEAFDYVQPQGSQW